MPYSRTGCYVDNDLNRRLGRVGKPYGTHVQHQDGSVTITDPKTAKRAGLGHYVDNPLNRSLGRVGKPYGTHILHGDGSVTITPPEPSKQTPTEQSKYQPCPSTTVAQPVNKTPMMTAALQSISGSNVNSVPSGMTAPHQAATVQRPAAVSNIPPSKAFALQQSHEAVVQKPTANSLFGQVFVQPQNVPSCTIQQPSVKRPTSELPPVFAQSKPAPIGSSVDQRPMSPLKATLTQLPPFPMTTQQASTLPSSTATNVAVTKPANVLGGPLAGQVTRLRQGDTQRTTQSQLGTFRSNVKPSNPPAQSQGPMPFIQSHFGTTQQASVQRPLSPVLTSAPPPTSTISVANDAVPSSTIAVSSPQAVAVKLTGSTGMLSFGSGPFHFPQQGAVQTTTSVSPLTTQSPPVFSQSKLQPLGQPPSASVQRPAAVSSSRFKAFKFKIVPPVTSTQQNDAVQKPPLNASIQPSLPTEVSTAVQKPTLNTPLPSHPQLPSKQNVPVATRVNLKDKTVHQSQPGFVFPPTWPRNNIFSMEPNTPSSTNGTTQEAARQVPNLAPLPSFQFGTITTATQAAQVADKKPTINPSPFVTVPQVFTQQKVVSDASTTTQAKSDGLPSKSLTKTTVSEIKEEKLSCRNEDKKSIPRGVPDLRTPNESAALKQVNHYLTTLGLDTDQPVATKTGKENPKQPEAHTSETKAIAGPPSRDLTVSPQTLDMVRAVQKPGSHDAPPAMLRVVREQQVLEKKTVEVVLQPPSGTTSSSVTQSESSQLKIEAARTKILPLVRCHVVPILYKELHLQSVVGSGSYGKVHKGTWRGREIAYKKLKYQQIMTKKRKQRFAAEVAIFTSLRFSHPNVVRMFGIVEEEGKYGIVMEYLIRTLHKAVLVDGVRFPKKRKKKIVTQIASALLYLHTHKDGPISHGDLKSANVLLDKDNNAKLSDYGMNMLKNASSSSHSGGGGTPRYSAPEVLRGERPTKMEQKLQSDIYSLSMVAFEVIVEDEPFEDFNVKQLENNVGHGTMRPPVDELSEGVASLLTRCWEKEAERRPTAGQFLEEWESLDPATMELIFDFFFPKRKL